VIILLFIYNALIFLNNRDVFLQFRNDINGLRAIAVIAVVLFHFNASWMPGGFAGVDVFYVISGFLMTRIIFKGIEQENFSILKFYVARANRIIPPLAVLCFVLLFFGWFYLNPIDYKELGKHVASSISFVSNIVYLNESGYFDAASHEKWLLHTWSLSVEWQFYIIYPLLLIAMRKFMSIKAMKMSVLVGTILGFIFCVVATYKWPDAAYYLLPARAWEMMIGGVAYLYPLTLTDKKKKALEWFGLFLIISAIFFITKESMWPGYLALIPVLGVFFIIQAQRYDSFITGNTIFQKLGAWSYSIYLWHWPFVVTIYYFNLSTLFIYAGILMSVIFGAFSHKYIESIKFKNHPVGTFTFYRSGVFYSVVLVALIGGVVFKYSPNSYLNPLPESVLKSIERKSYDCFDKPYQHDELSRFCKIADGKKKLFVFGDSHSYSALPAIESISKEQDIELTYTGYSRCPPLLDVYPLRPDQTKRNCNLLNEKVIKYIIDNDYDTVILMAKWTYYTEGTYGESRVQYLGTKENKVRNKANSIFALNKGIASTFKRYSESDIKVIVMLQVPMQEHNSDKIYYRSMENGHLISSLLNENSVSIVKHNQFQENTNKIIIEQASKYNNIMVIDPTDSMCKGDVCLVGDKNKSYYFDDDHLSIFGSYKLKAFFSHYI
jgi:peptidoglycan/LPS O-acetylase OafA/YrhL